MKKTLCLMLLAPLFLTTSCSEDIDESNLYVSLEETINDYLSSRPEFSNFHYILQRVGYDKILSAYGQYTCFAPTNEGVIEYIDSLYDDEINIALPHNGMTDRSLEGLTDSLCLDIALFHLMSSKTISIEMDKGNTLNTMINRDIISSLGEDGEILLNEYSTIRQMDIELQNGIVHEIDHALRRSNALVANELENHKEFRLFSQAVQLCGLGDTLVKQQRTGLILPQKESNEYIPKECRLGYTILAETDSAFRLAGINTLEQLIDSANTWYGNSAEWYDYLRQSGKQVSTGNDYRNPWNALNMFLRYHITEVKVPYQKLWQREHGEAPEFVQVEYYETMLPYTLFKVNRIGTNNTAVNRWVENSSLTDQVALLASPEIAIVRRPGIIISDKGYSCANGYIHPLTNGILRYDDGVAHGVLNERMRFDVMAILHESLSNNIRCGTDAELKGYNGGTTCHNGRFDGDGTVLFAENYFENLRVYNGNQTMLFYLSGQGVQWQNYQGDEMNCVGAYDFALRLPPVPAGMYEVRMGYSANGNRGMMQIYLGNTSELADMIPVDIPLDMRKEPSDNDTEANPNPFNGWCKADNCEDKGLATDVNMRYLGFMRAPLGCRLYKRSTKEGTTPLRSCRQPLRRILMRQNFEQRDYWMRFKTMIPENTGTQFHLEYIEIVPENVYNNSRYLEDMY